MPKKTTRTTSTSTDPATQYAKDVVAKKIVAGPPVRDACKRHLKDLKEGPKRGLVWDVGEVKRTIGYFRDILRLNGGEFEGQPFELNGWQCFVVGSLFGWKIKATGYRRFRTAYIETGKGSGKSPLAAGIGLKMLAADQEARAEVYAAAVKQDQAKVLFRDAVAMVQQSPELQSRLTLSGGADPDNIAFVPKGSFFRPISSERQGRGQSGPRPHCSLVDEIHEHPTNAIVEFLAAGVKHRKQPLTLMITNSGSSRQSVCYDYHQYGRKVAAGELENDQFFAYICALDKGDDPFKDESCWIKANPSLPAIPGYDYIRGEVEKARGLPSKEGLTKRLNFCVWTDAVESWITGDLWHPAQTSLNIDDYDGQTCWGGLDLSLSSDLTAFVLAFERAYREWDVFSWFWMPGDRLMELQDADNMAPHYETWRDAGLLFAPPGKVIDFEDAASFLVEVCGRFDVRGIAYDPARIEFLRAELEKRGDELPLLKHGQGFYKAPDTGLWMPSSISETEAGLKESRIRVNHSEVLDWCVASTVTRSSTIEPTDLCFHKGKSSGRIDGSVALVQAIGAATMREEDTTSIYESRGILRV